MDELAFICVYCKHRQFFHLYVFFLSVFHIIYNEHETAFFSQIMGSFVIEMLIRFASMEFSMIFCIVFLFILTTIFCKSANVVFFFFLWQGNGSHIDWLFELFNRLTMHSQLNSEVERLYKRLLSIDFPIYNLCIDFSFVEIKHYL